MEAQILAALFFGMGIGVLVSDVIITKTIVYINGPKVGSFPCCDVVEEEKKINVEETVLTE